jgi:zinc D-Ala-D-Ala carboxypeptidase
MKLSNNFSLEEFTKSATADRLGIDNAAPDIAVINLKVLCEEVLQPARDHFKNEFGDVFIKVNSGYRNVALCEAIGSSARSFHCHGMAADIELYIKNGTQYMEANEKLYYYIKENLPFTELIWEYGDDKMPAWVHVALSKHDKRKMIKRFPKGKELK